jgi:hypothetical protein
MSKANNRPPAGKSWTWQTLDFKRSDAWRTAGINVRRFIDFLEIEQMQKGGRENGWLKAPRRQLEEYGIAARHVSTAIDDAVARGLVDRKRGQGRTPNTYALTWLSSSDGTPPSDRWKHYAEPDKVVRRGIRREVAKGIRREVTRAVDVSEGRSQRPKTRVSEGKHPSRDSYQGGAVNSDLSGGAGASPAGTAAGGALPETGTAPAPAASRSWHAPVVIELPLVRSR